MLREGHRERLYLIWQCGGIDYAKFVQLRELGEPSRRHVEMLFHVAHCECIIIFKIMVVSTFE